METTENAQLNEESLVNAGASRVPTELSSGDLADLMSAFTEVTTKLETTHGQLRSEVSRLNTELHQANEALQRSRRLAALGEMAAGISHEIRNPLGSIKLYANMLIDDLAQMPEQCQIVEKIGRAVHGLDEIVGDVLTFAREMKVHWQPCDIAELIDMSLDMCCAEIDCAVVRDDVTSVELMCDPTLIQQAMINILRNAGEANRIAGGQRITVGVSQRMIGDDDGIVVSIEDEGDGMPADVIERMFNPFFTTRATGTGLGLAIVHRIIDAHRGKIEVTNNAERTADRAGSRVELYIPKKQAVVVTRSAGLQTAGISRSVALDAEERVDTKQQAAAFVHGVS